jgi:predicted phosphodiesterase
LPALAITCLLFSCQSRTEPLLDPTFPGAVSDEPAGVDSTPFPVASPSGFPSATPASAAPSPAASARVSPTPVPTGEPDEVEEDETTVDNITTLKAPANLQGDAAVQLALQLPLFSELDVRALGSVKVVLKRDGVLTNPVVAQTEVAGARVVDQVAGVHVNGCEAGGYILQLEALDEDGQRLGAAETQFKLEAGGAKALSARMAYVFADGDTTLRLTVTETPAVYVQAGTTSAMTVMWKSGGATTSKVVLNDAKGAYLTNKTGAAGRSHQLRFTGLQAGATYHYVAYEADKEVGKGQFKTAAAATQTKFRFAALGDSGRGTTAQFAVARQMETWKPEFVLHTGDVIYPSGEASSYGPYFITPYRALIAGTVFYPSPGNHDYRTDKAQPYLDFFEAPRANLDDTERYYTFTHGNAQFFSLDTNQAYAKGSAQYTWLSEQLAASKATWKVPFFHHPPYSSGDHGSSMGVREALAPLFKQHKVQLVLTGHDHHYERTKPQDGTTYVVTGGGGADLRDVKPQSFTEVGQARYHFTALTIDGKRLIVEAIDQRGSVFDSTTLTTP